MSVATRLLTAEEFFALPGSRHQELVQGEIVEVMPPGRKHGKLAFRIGKLLDRWADQGHDGEIGVEAGFILGRNPDFVRSPDVYYVRAERLPAGDVADGFWMITPDLAVEVVSPDDTAEKVRAKEREYLAAGTAAVWVVYPSTREVIVHTPDGLARTYGPDTTLESPALPGFSCAVNDIFAL